MRARPRRLIFIKWLNFDADYDWTIVKVIGFGNFIPKGYSLLS